MKKALRLLALVGVIAMSWFASEGPSYAAVECSTRDGFACTVQGASGRCHYYDEGSGCDYYYPCWCDRAFGPLQWRCGPNPSQTFCPV